MTDGGSFRVHQAARAIAEGGIVAHPTEGVYGLACDPYNRAAIERLLRIKRRDPAKGLILVAASLDQLLPFIAPLDAPTRSRLLARWPGPTTYIVAAAPSLDTLISGNRNTVAIRVTDHPLSAQLCKELERPIISTSANRADRPPARTAQEVRLRFGPLIDLILAGPLGGRDAPTEIRDAATDRIVRAG